MGFISKTYNRQKKEYYDRLKNGEKIEDIIADVRSNAVPDKPKRSQPEKPKQPEPQPEPQAIDVKDRRLEEGTDNLASDDNQSQQSEPQESSSDGSVEVTGNRALDVDWEERHFRICLAMISNSSVTKYSRAWIINQADRMIAELKKHYSKKSPNLPTEDKE